jgi:precorrin-6Y C5,15-methyltransferase (decarboxylating)
VKEIILRTISMNKIHLIGIGYKPLDKKACEIIFGSEVILASKRLAEVFKSYEEYETVKDKLKIINNVDETIDFIRAEERKCRRAEERKERLLTSELPNFRASEPPSLRASELPNFRASELPSFRTSELPNFRAIVLLASGDPMFFGIGRRVVKEFGKDIVEIIPDLSSVQLAFSRIKEPWDDAFLMSLHGGPDPEKRRRLPYTINDIPSLLQRHNKIAILTDKENSPSEIAKVLNLSPIAHSLLPVMYVCERLGYPDERITEGSPEEIEGMTFSEPNVVIIKMQDTRYKIHPPLSPLNKGGIEGGYHASCIMHHASAFGLKEDEITHSRGLITKDEIRAVTIHKLRLPKKGVLWDIGAGSGSVSIEAAGLYPELKVFAIEKDEDQISHIRENKIKFTADNVEAIKGNAPEVFTTMPHPDRVFIGGSGGRLKEIIDIIAKMKTSIIVINATTIETLNEAVSGLESNGFKVEVSELSVSRSKNIAGKKHMSALNPVFITVGERTI